ncbi:hypothetical protein PFISCL1PPCAC_12670, partial [Pristionchus fissidentatus]
LIAASIGRVAMMSAYMGVFFSCSIERLISTFAWSWYEKMSIETVSISILVEGLTAVQAFFLASALVFS